MRIAFSLFDKNGDGAIDLEEVKEVMTSLGRRWQEDELRRIFDLVDTDGRLYEHSMTYVGNSDNSVTISTV